MPPKRPKTLTSINRAYAARGIKPKMGRAMRGLSLQRAERLPPWPPFLSSAGRLRQLSIATSSQGARPYLRSVHTADVCDGLAAGSGPLGHLWRRGQGDGQGRTRPRVASWWASNGQRACPDPFVKFSNSSPAQLSDPGEQLPGWGPQAGAAALHHDHRPADLNHDNPTTLGRSC